MKKEFRTSQIHLNVEYELNGFFNGDGDGQKDVLKECGLLLDDNAKDNLMFHKKVFNTDGTFRYKVSANCFKSGLYHNIPNGCVAKMKSEIQMAMLSKKDMLCRGYLATSKDASSWSSCAFAMTSDLLEGESVRRTVVPLDTNTSRSYEYDPKKKVYKKSSTSLFSKENLNNGIKLYNEIVLNLDRRQFISFDERFGQREVNLDVEPFKTISNKKVNLKVYNRNLFVENLKREIEGFKCIGGDDVVFFNTKGLADDIYDAEEGLLMDEKNVATLAEYYIGKLLRYHNVKNGGSLKCVKVSFWYYDEDGHKVEPQELTLDNYKDFSFLPIGNYVQSQKKDEILKLIEEERKSK